MSLVNGLANSGLSDGIQGAAQNFSDTSQAQKQATAGMTNFQNPGIPTGTMPDMTPEQIAAAAPGGGVGFSDPNHPAWGVLSSMVGAGGAPASSPIQPQQLEKGGEVDNGSGTPIHPWSLGEKIAQGVKDAAGAVFGSGAGARAADASREAVSGAQTQVDHMQNGGVVRLNHGTPTVRPSFTRGPALPVGPNSGIVPASTEGELLTMDAGGMVPDGYIPVGGQGTPPMTGRAAGISAGLGAGMTMGRNLRQAWLDHEARATADDNASYIVGIGNNIQQDDNSQQGVIGKARDAVESFFHHLHEGTLDDNHKPNGPQAIPGATPDGSNSAGGPALPVPQASPTGSPPAGPPGAQGAAPAPPAPAPGTPAAGGPAPPGSAPVVSGGSAVTPPSGAASSPVQSQVTKDAITMAAQDPQVKAGIPDKTPDQSGQPHSLTPEYWEHSNMLMQKAVRAAALAGEDPAKVYESMNAMRTAHIQGQVFRQGATAYAALQNNDEASLKQALSNINYYLPNGQDIKFHTAAQSDVDKGAADHVGQLMYRNPFYGMYGDKGPEFQAVNQQHIQSLMAAATNPQTVQDSLLKSYSAQREAQNNATKASGEFLTGQGRQMMGASAYLKANIALQNQDVNRRLTIATADQREAEAGLADRKPVTSGGPKISMATYQNLQKQGMDYVDKITLGQPQAVPTMVPRTDPQTGQPMKGPDGKPVMVPNLSPGAGKVLPDGTRIPSSFQGLTPDQQEEVKKNTATILGSNFGIPGMNVAKAADLGARITRAETNPNAQHMNPETHQPEKDFIFDAKKGIAYVWVGNDYERVYMYPNVAEESQQAIPTGSGGGGGSSNSPDDDMPNNMG